MMKRPLSKHYIFRGKKISQFYPNIGKHIDISSIAAPRYSDRKKFNYMYVEFKDLFVPLIDSKIPELQRITTCNDSLLFPTLEVVEEHLREITDIARIDYDLLTKDDIYRYKTALLKIFQKLKNLEPWHTAEHIIVPLRGGGMIANLFPDINERTVPFDCKRIPLSDAYGNFGFGMHVQKKNGTVKYIDKLLDNSTKKTITFLEICVASGMTTLGFMLDILSRGIKVKELIIVCAALSQQGYLLISEFARKNNLRIKFVTGKLIYALSDFYTDPIDALLEGDGSKTIGDAVNIMGYKR
ncbi:TPA: hypothetical protein HA241_05840 [Candidatus Woesearchaeota archaeon]|nr:hypothetical protein [Candidatus Woesearchaeota archaeon]